MEQVVVFIEDWPPKQCVNVCEGKPWTRDIDCRRGGTVAHRAAECRRRWGCGQDRGRPRAVKGEGGEGKKSRPESGAALRHPSRRVLGRCCFTGQPGNIHRVFFVETRPTFWLFYVGLGAAAHHTPGLGLCVSRYKHHATLSRQVSREGCVQCIVVSYSLWVPEAESHPTTLVMRAIRRRLQLPWWGWVVDSLPDGGVPFRCPGKERVPVASPPFACHLSLPAWVLASKTLQLVDWTMVDDAPRLHSTLTPRPSLLACVCDTVPMLSSMPPTLANRSAPQVAAAAPPRLTRRRTSTTPSFPGRNSDDNQAHCGSRVLPWPWMRDICRRT